MTRRNLILTGGIGHPFEDAAPALKGVLESAGIESEVDFDIEGGLKRLEQEAFGLLTVYALRWRMLDGEKYAPHRAEWAFSLSSAGRTRLQEFVAAGGALLALHTAVICFDDWSEWGNILGARWEWGKSFHPPRGPVSVRNSGSTDPIVAGLPDFTLPNDEVYSRLHLVDAIDPLLLASASRGRPCRIPRLLDPPLRQRKGCLQPPRPRPRLARAPVQRRLHARSAQWLLGAKQAEVEAL